MVQLLPYAIKVLGQILRISKKELLHQFIIHHLLTHGAIYLWRQTLPVSQRWLYSGLLHYKVQNTQNSWVVGQIPP